MKHNILYNSSYKNKLISGAFVLILSNLLTKIIGVIFKIPLYNVLKDIGMSYFNTSYNIFITLYVIIVTGLPVASSIMISNSSSNGNIKTIKKIFNISLLIFIILGIIGSTLLFFLSKQIAVLTGNVDAGLSIKYISPAVFFICICCAIRGYYQGHKKMLSTSISEIIESVGKFALGYLLAIIAINKGYSLEISSAIAILGVVAGELFSTIFMIIVKIFKKCNYEIINENEEVLPAKSIIKSLFIISFPIMLEALMLNLSSAIDTFTIVNILTGQFGVYDASRIFGDYSTCVITLFRIPSAFFVPIATVVIPFLVEAKAKNDNRQDLILNGITKLFLIIGIPITFGMIILAKPILTMFFDSSNIELMYPLLIIMSLSILTSGYYTISTAYLQAYDKRSKPVIAAAIGVAVKLVLNIILLKIPMINIYGAPISSFFSYLSMAIMNYIFVRKNIPIKFKLLNKFYKPLIVSIISSSFTIGSYLLFNYLVDNVFAIIMSIIVTVITYLLLIIIFNVFNKEEIIRIPKGEKIYNFLIKVHLIKESNNIS